MRLFNFISSSIQKYQIAYIDSRELLMECVIDVKKNNSIAIDTEFIPKLNKEHSGYCWCAFECWPKNLHSGLKNTLNNKAIKGKLQTILDLIT